MPVPTSVALVVFVAVRVDLPALERPVGGEAMTVGVLAAEVVDGVEAVAAAAGTDTETAGGERNLASRSSILRSRTAEE